jgi:GT2 family glycosyltransferase
MDSIVAVVVTYNRRELLELTLGGLEAQTTPPSRIVVIDNASTDDTPAYLATRSPALPTTVERSEENLGGAGGFARGMEIAYELGADGVWLMDDDTVPQPDALAGLVGSLDDAEAHLGYRPSFSCSLVQWKDGSLCEMNLPVPRWDWARGHALGRDWILVESCSFVSVLVTRESIRASGLPLADYFIWHDDVEYTYRLSKRVPGIYSPSSRVSHLLPSNRGVNFGDVTDENLWKFRYGVRNSVSSAVRHRRPKQLAELAENMYLQLRGSSVPPRLRGKLVVSAAKGVIFKPTIRYPRTVL